MNSIIAANTSPDLSGPFRTLGHNLIGAGTGSNGITNGVDGDLVGSTSAPLDPLLGPLANNGGPTLTMAPLPGSPAINAGDAALTGAPYYLTTDQRGFPRSVGGKVDIGAVEVGSQETNLATYSVSVSASPSSGGSVGGEGTFPGGSSQTVTAVPAAGYTFTDWTVGTNVVSSSATYAFSLGADVSLTANFDVASNSNTSSAGTYRGLFYDPIHGVTPASSGIFSIKVANKGTYSGNLQMGNRRVTLAGSFDENGASSISAGGLKVAMTLAQTGVGNQILGTVGNAAWQATLEADRVAFDAKNPAVTYEGNYTMIVFSTNDSETIPGGDSYGTLKVSPSGTVTLSGMLADGSSSPFTLSTTISGNGRSPVYEPLYQGKGELWGWITNVNGKTVEGALSWIKPPGGGVYPSGFTNLMAAAGALYVPPPKNTRSIALTNGVVVLSSGGLPAPVITNVTLRANNEIKTNGMTLNITTRNGLFSGDILFAGDKRGLAVRGAVLQNTAAAYGFYLGPHGQIGSIAVTRGSP